MSVKGFTAYNVLRLQLAVAAMPKFVIIARKKMRTAKNGIVKIIFL